MIDGLKEGKFVEGMEEFYADDVVNEVPHSRRRTRPEALARKSGQTAQWSVETRAA